MLLHVLHAVMSHVIVFGFVAHASWHWPIIYASATLHAALSSRQPHTASAPDPTYDKYASLLLFIRISD